MRLGSDRRGPARTISIARPVPTTAARTGPTPRAALGRARARARARRTRPPSSPRCCAARPMPPRRRSRPRSTCSARRPAGDHARTRRAARSPRIARCSCWCRVIRRRAPRSSACSPPRNSTPGYSATSSRSSSRCSSRTATRRGSPTVLEARLDDRPRIRSTARRVLQRIVELAEHKLGDLERALDAALRWLAADPASQQALDESRAARRAARPVARGRAAGSRPIVDAPDADDASARRPGRAARVPRAHPARAARPAQTPRPRRTAPRSRSSPTTLAALDPLIEILRQRGDGTGARRRASPARQGRAGSGGAPRGVRRGRAAVRAGG